MKGLVATCCVIMALGINLAVLFYSVDSKYIKNYDIKKQILSESLKNKDILEKITISELKKSVDVYENAIFLYNVNRSIQYYLAGLLTIIASVMLYFQRVNETDINVSTEVNNVISGIDQRISNILTGTSIMPCKIFNNGNELKYYLLERLETAQDRVLDLTWAPFELPGEVISDIEAECTEKITKLSKRGVSYTEIFVFDQIREGQKVFKTSRLHKLKHHFEYLKENNTVSPYKYNLSYFSSSFFKTLSSVSEIPRMQFMVIDGEEVVFTASRNGRKRCAMHSVELATIFEEYFNEYYKMSNKLIEDGWIKDKDTIHQILAKDGR